jgi:acyl-CoA synthetase (AMP-forming)/AMP-acid ligase II
LISRLRTAAGIANDQPHPSERSDLGLLTLEPSFRRTYAAAVAQHRDRPFITFVYTDGSERELTFAGFHSIVEAFVKLVKSSASGKASNTARDDGKAGTVAELADEPQTIVTVAGNNVEQLALAVSALLTGSRFCPIGIDDSEVRIQQKIATLRKEPQSKLKIWLSNAAHEKFPNLEYDGLIETSLAEAGQTTQATDFDTVTEQVFLNTVSGAEKNRDLLAPFILIFTSGSTGHSKIVEQTELGILTNADALIHHYKLNPAQMIATALPVSHVNAFEFSFLCSLFSGAQLLLFEQFNLSVFAQTIAKRKPTIVSLVPGILKTLCDHQARLPQGWCDSVEYVMSAAAPLSLALAKESSEKFRFRLLQGYGLSEAINFSALMPTGLSTEEHAHWMAGFSRPSIGTAVRGSEIFILGPNGEHLGPGQIGAVAIRGPVVMRGYQGMANKDIFAGEYLNTGDLGSYELDEVGRAFYFIHGRVKEIIKRYGRTVSLIEIDELMAPCLSDEFSAIAVGFEHDSATEELGIVLRSNLKPGDFKLRLQKLISHLNAEVTDFMRPRVLVTTTDPIRTPSGKARRWEFAHLFAHANAAIFSSEPQLLEPAPAPAHAPLRKSGS